MSERNENAKRIIEAILMASHEPISKMTLQNMFSQTFYNTQQTVESAVNELQQDYQTSAIELVELAGGYRFQVRTSYTHWVNQCFQHKPTRYSQALLETLALIVYRQPITRAEIELIRGVKVSSHLMKTLLDHEWIEIVDYKQTPGKPALYGTTQQFLNHFNLKSLNELPSFPDLEQFLIQSVQADD